MSDTPHFTVGDVPSTSDQQPPADVASGEAIRVRADAWLAKRVKYLQAELDWKSTLVAKLSSDLATAQRQIADANERVKMLEAERDDARADADHHARSFDRLLSAMQSMRSGEFAHVTDALQRVRMQ
jgi:chromosome segregation ATPase